MTQTTTNIRSVRLPGEINGSTKGFTNRACIIRIVSRPSPFRVVVTCVPRYINGIKKRPRICARRHLRGLTSHTYVVGWPGFIWGTCRGNTPRSFSGKNSGNCISTGVVDEAQSPVCTWQSRRATSHAAGGTETDTLCLYIVVYLDAVLTLYSCYLRTTVDGTIVFYHSIWTGIKSGRILFSLPLVSEIVVTCYLCIKDSHLIHMQDVSKLLYARGKNNFSPKNFSFTRFN